MGKSFDYVKRKVVNFKLDLCCWVAPVRIGLLVIGYLNIILAVISLVGLSDESFSPILMQVQEAIMDDNAKKPIPILAYAAELSFSVILLTALYQKDVSLLRLYQKYCITAIVASIMVYSMVVAAIGIVIGIVLVLSILFQVYVLFLVRSMIVALKLEKKNLELPTLVLSAVTQETQEVKPVSDVEAPSDPDDDDEEEEKAENSDTKDRLETVDEHPKEESTTEEEVKVTK